MTKPKSCDDCKWCRTFNTMFPNEYTGKACYKQFKNKPAWYVGTIHEMKDLTPCDMFESKNKYDELLNFIAKERMINSQYGSIEDDKAYEKVMEILEKVEQLEEENKKLKEKQTPKKPILDILNIVQPMYCPNCESRVKIPQPYCCWCGQKLDWSEIECKQ